MPLPNITPSGVSTAFLYNTQVSAGDGFTIINNQLPPNVNAPIIFEPGCTFTGNQLKVVLIVSGNSPLWGGAQIWASLDNTTYGQLGVVYRGATQGVLTATFPSGSSADFVNTLSVDVSESLGQIIGGSTTDASLGVTLAYVDTELVGYSNVTLTAPAQYNLAPPLYRGLFGSTIGSHASGTLFGLVNSHAFSQVYPPNLVGQTVYFKFPSFNTTGSNLQTLASVPAYSYMLTGVGVCATGGPGMGCPVDIGLAAGCDEDWGYLDSCISSTCDWGTLTTLPAQLCVNMGVINK